MSIPKNQWTFKYAYSLFGLIGWTGTLGMPAFDRLSTVTVSLSRP
jgi:hypothetical protein